MLLLRSWAAGVPSIRISVPGQQHHRTVAPSSTRCDTAALSKQKGTGGSGSRRTAKTASKVLATLAASGQRAFARKGAAAASFCNRIDFWPDTCGGQLGLLGQLRSRLSALPEGWRRGRVSVMPGWAYLQRWAHRSSARSGQVLVRSLVSAPTVPLPIPLRTVPALLAR